MRAGDNGHGEYRPVTVRMKETEAPAWLRTLADHEPALPQEADVYRPTPLVDVAGFTGRGSLLADLDALADEQTRSPVVAVLAGMPGAGKTAIAATWAHRNAHRFPDGLLTVDLHPRASEGALRTDDALAQLLRGAGVAASSMPAAAGERERMWWNVTRHRRLLVVLDGAADSGQVRPLLAHGPGCMTLITSRSDLETLVAFEAARPLEVPPLPEGDAVELVRAVVGDRRAEEEPDAVRTLVRLCGCLPLAIRLASAKLALHPHWTVARVAGELADHPLTVLRSADDPTVAVSAAFDAAYRGMSGTARRTFRLLGLVPGPDFTGAAVAPLLGVTVREATDRLATLERLHLVEPGPADRYRFHDLLAAFARERLDAEEEPRSRDSARRALLAAYLATAVEHRRRIGRRSRRLHDDDASVTKPRERLKTLRWFAAEWEDLTAAATAALDADMPETAIDLADALFDMLDLSGHPWRNVNVQRTATRAAEAIEDWRAMALSLMRQAHAQRVCGDYLAALDSAEQARERAAEVGDPRLESDAYRVLGLVRWSIGQHGAALSSATRALEFARDCHDQKAEGSALNLSAQIKRRRGDYTPSYADAAAALGIWRRLHDRENGAVALDAIARVLRRLPGRTAEALAPQRQALAIFREYGDEHAQGGAYDGMARIMRRLRRYEASLSYAAKALELRERIADERGVAESLDTHARLYQAIAEERGSREDLLTARRYAEAAIARAQGMDDRVGEATALSNCAMILLALGELDIAEITAERAVGVGEDLEDPFGQAQRMEHSAAVLRALGRTSHADARDRLAKRLRVATVGDEPGEEYGDTARRAPGQAS